MIVNIVCLMKLTSITDKYKYDKIIYIYDTCKDTPYKMNYSTSKGGATKSVEAATERSGHIG